MLGQDLPDATLAEACGESPSFICRRVLDWTDSVAWAEFADVVFAKPLTILLIIVIAVVVRSILVRVIGRFERSLAGDNPPSRRLKRRLRKSAVGGRLPARVLDTGAYSIRSAARAATLGVVLRSLATFLVWTIAVLTILGEIGINLGPLIAGAGIAGVALGFGAQSLVRDFLAGMFILLEDQYGVGDIADVGEASGVVEAVSLRTTRIRDVNGVMWHVPNGQILRVGNMSQQWARALLDVSVAHGTDIEQAEAVIKEVADGLRQEEQWKRRILEEPSVWGVEDITPDGITIRLVLKTLPAAQWDVMRALRPRLKRAFDEAGIEIPHVQRTVWVRHADADADAEPAPAKRPPSKRAKKTTRSSGGGGTSS